MSEELLHVRVLCANRNAELRAVAPAFGLELIGVILTATLPFAAVARSGLRATGVGYDRKVTVLQFIAGFALLAVQRIDGS